jgi:hypothetical protein
VPPQLSIPYGARITVSGFPGAAYVLRNKDDAVHVGLILDDDVTELVRWFHPGDPTITWHGRADPGLIKPWWVKAPWIADWSNPVELFTVHASHFKKARYKGWSALDAQGLVTRADLLAMRAKRAPDVDICSIVQLGVQTQAKPGS